MSTSQPTASGSGGEVADAIIIGAGVIGCSIAYALAKAGHRVVVVDSNRGPGQGSTSSSAAIIRFHYSTMAGVATAWEAHYAWTDWETFLGGPDSDGTTARFHRTGALVLDSPMQNREVMTGLFDTVGVPWESLDAAAIRERFGWLDPGRHYPPHPVDSEEFWNDPQGEIGGFYTPEAGFMDDPSFVAHNLATAATRRGVRFRFGQAVTAIDVSPGRVSGVCLADGSQLVAPIVVNVAGPFSGRVNEMAGVSDDFNVHTRPLRVEVHEVHAPAGFDRPDGPGPVVADTDLGTYFKGTPAGELLIGGAEPACDPMHWLASPDDLNPQVTQELFKAQIYRAARRMPELGVPNRPCGIAAMYDASDDWIPIYDRTRLPGYYVAMGTSGNQFKNAPVVGEYLRAIIEACENGRDHDNDPVVYDMPHSGVRLDLSAFSRRRERTPGSSNTVMG